MAIHLVSSSGVGARRIYVAPKRVSGFVISAGRDAKAFGSGGKGIRTPGLLIANETLYQLSYTPVIGRLRLARAADFSSIETNPASSD